MAEKESIGTIDSVKRPPRREWEEACPSCGGCGKVRKVESRVLWTSAEYTERFGDNWRPTPLTLDPKYDAPADALICVVIGGACSIYEACREGAELAVLAERPVAFTFNEHLVIVRPGVDPDAAAREWWKRAYGETPEESWSRR